MHLMFDPFPESPTCRPANIGSGADSGHHAGSAPDPHACHWWVVGIGNYFRGDDAVGLHIARRVAQWADPNVKVTTYHDTVLPLLDLFAADRHILVVDAVRSATKPGTVYRLDLLTHLENRNFAFPSNHLLDLPAIVGLARELDRLPAALLLVGVEAESVARGAPLSASVKDAIPSALAAIRACIDGSQT